MLSYLVVNQVSQPIPAPILGICVWSSLTVFLWSIGLAVRDGVVRLKRLHQVPCSRCCYFTGDYRLKCAVNPCIALTEAAIDCRDFVPSSMPPLPCSKTYSQTCKR
ncbi:hypothetical protein [Leptolyngbya sp. 7M]|uniref:hypothetical protein n=1 Tax=Leptolyngbya sp. 7M TaxID=2812896 RepID=UPI001B8B220E|nr:hypothetical protein [Leptolyngbya sp. 7M]QYO64190.1 hypothetical protein JVX88_31330 [Leptolyngbya sp. 7M]